MKKLQIKHIVFAAFAIIMALTIGYKYYEWSVMNSLMSQYNSSLHEELSQSETINKHTNEFQLLVTTQSNKEAKTTQASQSAQIDTILSKTKLLIDLDTEYQRTTQINKKTFQELQGKAAFLFGAKKQFFTEVATAQVTYYDQELLRVKREFAVLHFMYDLFAVAKDGMAMQDFTAETNGVESTYAENLQLISSLKKYTEENYTFPNADEIRTYYPKAMTGLEKYKAFYGTYYEIVEDVVKGDQESADYKKAKLQEDALAIDVDYKYLIGDELDKEKEYSKQALTGLVKEIRAIKAFEKNKSVNYPLLPSVATYDEDLVLCETYIYKAANVYHDVMNEYPNAQNTTDLIAQLHDLSPRTDELDKQFASKVLTIQNKEKEMVFTCNNQTTKYTFITKKE